MNDGEHIDGLDKILVDSLLVWSKGSLLCLLPKNIDLCLQLVVGAQFNKMAGEQYHLLYNNVYGIAATALRLTNTIGPRMRIKDARQTFLGIWIRLLVEGKPFEVWEGQQLRDFTYVDDAVDAFLLAAASEASNGQVFNLGGDCIITLKDLAELLIQHLHQVRQVIPQRARRLHMLPLFFFIFRNPCK